jgi:NADP-dependent 3-hydroxy acid dehydrogenase YdfG
MHAVRICISQEIIAMSFRGKVAIVTGSSSGIGLDTSVTLAQNAINSYHFK